MTTPTELYRHFDKENKLLYIGVSQSARQRLDQHKVTAHWFNSIANVTIEKHPTREAALKAEKEAILTEKPLHNTFYNGDKLALRRAENYKKKELTYLNREFRKCDTVIDVSTNAKGIITEIDKSSMTVWFYSKKSIEDMFASYPPDSELWVFPIDTTEVRITGTL